MTFNYSQMADMAASQIDAAGVDVVILRAALGSGPAYNPGSGDTQEIQARVVDLSIKELEEDGVKKAYRTFLMKADAEPQENDRVKYQEREYGIEKVRPVAPGGVNIIFKVYCHG